MIRIVHFDHDRAFSKYLVRDLTSEFAKHPEAHYYFYEDPKFLRFQSIKEDLEK